MDNNLKESIQDSFKRKFEKKRVFYHIKEQIIASTHKDLTGEKLNKEELESLKDQLSNNMFFGTENHQDFGSPSMIIQKSKIIEKDGEFLLVCSIDLLNKNILDKLKTGKYKGFSISFSK